MSSDRIGDPSLWFRADWRMIKGNASASRRGIGHPARIDRGG